jgi:hypothetical protein
MDVGCVVTAKRKRPRLAVHLQKISSLFHFSKSREITSKRAAARMWREIKKLSAG